MAKLGDCKDCTFFQALENKLAESFEGECHLNPPDPNEGFIVVKNDQWCGQFEAA